MESGQQLAIWLHDEAARLFLGLRGERPVSRWVAVGTVLEHSSPIGVWMDVSYVEERRPDVDGNVKGFATGYTQGSA